MDYPKLFLKPSSHILQYNCIQPFGALRTATNLQSFSAVFFYEVSCQIFLQPIELYKHSSPWVLIMHSELIALHNIIMNRLPSQLSPHKWTGLPKMTSQNATSLFHTWHRTRISCTCVIAPERIWVSGGVSFRQVFPSPPFPSNMLSSPKCQWAAKKKLKEVCERGHESGATSSNRLQEEH